MSKNAKRFYIEKYATKEKLDLQLKHVSGTELEIADKKVHSILFSKLKKSSRKIMSVLDFIIIRGQQFLRKEKKLTQ